MPSRLAPAAVPGLPSLPAVFALLVAALVCASWNVMNDGDTYTHIAAGQWMLEHAAVLDHDPFTSTVAGQPWSAHEWLSEVLLAVAYRVAGPPGVILLTAAAAAAAFALLAHHVGRSSGWIATLLLTAAAACAVPSLLARPHALALPVVECWTASLLVARQAGRAPRPWLLGLMVAWANLHGGYAVGIILGFLFALEATLAREREIWRWWAFAVGTLVAGLLTPQGWNGLLFPLRLLRMESLARIQEWQPTDFTQDVTFEAALLALVLLLCSGRVQVPLPRALLLLELLHMALTHMRHTGLFGMVTALVLAEPVGRGFGGAAAAGIRGLGRGVCWLGLAVVALLTMAERGRTVDGKATPVSAVAQLPATARGSAGLNSYHFGGYLSLLGLHPFIDGRAELFGDQFITDFLSLSVPDGKRLAAAVARYRLEWALLAVNDPLVGRFDMLAGWRRHYVDGVAVVFVRE